MTLSFAETSKFLSSRRKEGSWRLMYCPALKISPVGRNDKFSDRDVLALIEHGYQFENG